jgi:hypothetical protein
MRNGYWADSLCSVYWSTSPFFAIGVHWIEVEQWTANTFIMAAFGEMAGMTFFIIKYLFPKVSADVLTTLEKL